MFFPVSIMSVFFTFVNACKMQKQAVWQGNDIPCQTVNALAMSEHPSKTSDAEKYACFAWVRETTCIY